MQIVDAQIHLWGSGLPVNAAHRQVTAFTAEEAIELMDEGGVDAAVINPPTWDPGAVEMAFEKVDNYPGRFAIMGSLPLDDPSSLEQIASWRTQPGMLGLRYIFVHEPDQQLLVERRVDWLWEAAGKAGVPVAVQVPYSLPQVGDIANRFPQVRLTIDHLGGLGGFTTEKDARAMTHFPELLKLAKYPNVAVKATGAPGYCSEGYPFTPMHTYLEQIYDAFGPQRMFWGTDITKMPVPWKQCIEMFTESLPWLAKEDLPLVMGQALCDWWGWDRTKDTGGD